MMRLRLAPPFIKTIYNLCFSSSFPQYVNVQRGEIKYSLIVYFFLLVFPMDLCVHFKLLVLYVHIHNFDPVFPIPFNVIRTLVTYYGCFVANLLFIIHIMNSASLCLNCLPLCMFKKSLWIILLQVLSLIYSIKYTFINCSVKISSLKILV